MCGVYETTLGKGNLKHKIKHTAFPEAMQKTNKKQESLLTKAFEKNNDETIIPETHVMQKVFKSTNRMATKGRATAKR